MHLCSYNSHFVACWTRQHELQKYAWAGNIIDMCSCHEGSQSCSSAVDPSAQPRRMIQQNKQTLQYLKALDKCMWVSIYTKLKGSKQHAAVSATKSEATPWLPSGSLLVPQSTAWRWPGPGWDGTAKSHLCYHYLQSSLILGMPLHAHLFPLRWSDQFSLTSLFIDNCTNKS